MAAAQIVSVDDLEKKEEESFRTGPLSVLTTSVKTNSQVRRAPLACAARLAESHAVFNFVRLVEGGSGCTHHPQMRFSLVPVPAYSRLHRVPAGFLAHGAGLSFHKRGTSI